MTDLPVFSAEIPLDVPSSKSKVYLKNYENLTFGTGNLLMFAGDQRIEHLSSSFYGTGITPLDVSPAHLFNIASVAKVSGLATQIGLINKYGEEYSQVPFIVKLNSQSKLRKDAYGYSKGAVLASIEQVMTLKEDHKLNISAVGYTLLLGIEDEGLMMEEAATLIKEAHKSGLVFILWVYPKGPAVKDETDPLIITSAVSAASALGPDFIKINAPKESGKNLDNLSRAVQMAGKVKIVTAGGKVAASESYLFETYKQLHIAKTYGVAIGRNLHQRNVAEAVKLADSLYDIIIDKKDIKSTLKKNYSRI